MFADRRSRSSVNFGEEGGKTFLPEIVCIKINKMPAVYMILPKNVRILDDCPKIFFSRFLGPPHAPPSPTPMSPTLPINFWPLAPFRFCFPAPIFLPPSHWGWYCFQYCLSVCLSVCLSGSRILRPQDISAPRHFGINFKPNHRWSAVLSELFWVQSVPTFRRSDAEVSCGRSVR